MNGCDENDFFVPHLKYDISNTQGIDGAIITDETGIYNIDLQAEIHTITPRFENPDYFSSSPQSIVVDFPTEASPYTQDFCITPIGEKDDLEVVIFSSTDIRPGFKGVYKVIYRNKGNTVQSGDVRLSFQKDKMEIDFLSQNFWDQIEELPTHQDIFVYCRSGRRSIRTCTLMRNGGFDNNKIFNLDGGYVLWLENQNLI